MKYCSCCGSEVELKIPKDDNLPRYCCTKCDDIHYQNPKLIAGTIPVKEEKILLCRRAIHPRYGLWTLPAGFLENGETIGQGAFRETLEETSTEVKMGNLYTIFNIPQISQIYMLFLAEVLQEDFGQTPESLEVRLFEEDEIPWEELPLQRMLLAPSQCFYSQKLILSIVRLFIVMVVNTAREHFSNQ